MLIAYFLILYVTCPSKYLQIRVKHMITQGAVEQSPMPSGYSRSINANSGRILETNTENLLRMVLDMSFSLLMYYS